MGLTPSQIAHNALMNLEMEQENREIERINNFNAKALADWEKLREKNPNLPRTCLYPRCIVTYPNRKIRIIYTE